MILSLISYQSIIIFGWDDMGDELNFNSSFDGNALKGKMYTPKGAVGYSKGQRELTPQGYERYNIDDDGDVYIAKMPERAFFNDGEPIFVKARSGVFVGSNWKQKEQAVEKKQTVKPSNPNDLFSNIQRGSGYDVRTHVGTYDKGRVVEQQPLTDFVSKMNARMVNVGAAPRANVSSTSSADMAPKVDMTGVNMDNVQVRPLDKPRAQKKFVFVNGKLVQAEVSDMQIDSTKESRTVSQ